MRPSVKEKAGNDSGDIYHKGNVEMKKHKYILFASCILLVAVAASVFVTIAVQNGITKNEMITTMKRHASDASTDFSEFVKTGKESYYVSAVASFYAFEETYLAYNGQEGSDPNHLFMNEVYGYLILSPEKAKEHAQELSDIMDILAEDPLHANGYYRFSVLRNVLKG